MTLRELLNHVMNRGGSFNVHSIISDVYYKGENIKNVCEQYTTVIRGLMELPPGPVSRYITKDHVIQVKDYADGGEEYVGVGLYDTAEGKGYACDFCSWRDLIDLDIEDKIGLSLENMLAHILWEITFWGYSEEKIAEQAQLMEVAANEEHSRLESIPLSALMSSLSGI